MIPSPVMKLQSQLVKKYLTDFETAEYIKRACERKKSVFKDIFEAKFR